MSFQASPLLAVTFGTLATTNLESTVLVAVCLFHLGTLLSYLKLLGFSSSLATLWIAKVVCCKPPCCVEVKCFRIWKEMKSLAKFESIVSMLQKGWFLQLKLGVVFPCSHGFASATGVMPDGLAFFAISIS